MKGVVDDVFGLEVTEEVIKESPTLSTGGAYTSVGTYPHHEIISMVVALSKATKVPVPDLVETFGKHLFGVLANGHPEFVENASDLFDFLNSIEEHIHVEVRKLYPDAQLPNFDTLLKTNKRMEMLYRSERSMADLAVGLIHGAAERYNEAVVVNLEDVSSEKDGKQVKITIERK